MRIIAASLVALVTTSHAFSVTPNLAAGTSTSLSYSSPMTAYDALPPKKYTAPPAATEPKVNEVKETARALFRVFQLGDRASGNDYPALSRATGWSGEVGSGPTTAYDCLAPKKYTAPVVVKEKTTEKPKVDEVKETARALFRVFQLGDRASGNDYPALSRATGWSGEVGSGPTTAYDCLTPKKYSP